MIFYDTTSAAGGRNVPLCPAADGDSGWRRHTPLLPRPAIRSRRSPLRHRRLGNSGPLSSAGRCRRLPKHPAAIVLRTRNLPWERQLWPGRRSSRNPGWPAGAFRGRFAERQSRGTGPARSPISNRMIRHLVTTENGATILLPRFIRDGDEQTPLRLLDMDLSVFLKICPRRRTCLAWRTFARSIPRTRFRWRWRRTVSFLFSSPTAFRPRERIRFI